MRPTVARARHVSSRLCSCCCCGVVAFCLCRLGLLVVLGGGGGAGVRAGTVAGCSGGHLHSIVQPVSAISQLGSRACAAKVGNPWSRCHSD